MNQRQTKPAKAIQQVRHLDLSNRRWDNGWGLPVGPYDTLESHPYFFGTFHWGGEFHMRELAEKSGNPRVQKPQEGFERPIILNEYAWLWLDRNGAPTIYTDKAYASLLVESSTANQHRETYARLLAALTEFWRAHRECAAVMHFCGLGYSRPGLMDRPTAGVTSDNFIDVKNLVFEPYFEKFVKDSFAPVGVMIDLWDDQYQTNTKHDVSVYVINDLYDDANGSLRLQLNRGGKIVSEQSQAITVASLGREIVQFDLTLPGDSGDYELIAEFMPNNGEPVRSYRTFKIQ